MIFGSPLDSYLDPGEKLVWSGQPKQGVRLKPSDVVMIPASLAWGGFAFLWEASVLGWTPFFSPQRDSSDTLLALVGVPFCLIGLQFIFGRFFTDAYARSKTWYGVTDKRVMVLRAGLTKSVSVSSIDYPNLTELHLVERKDNSGDVLFSAPKPMVAWVKADASEPLTLIPGFCLLPQARTTYNLIREMQSKARK